MMLDNFPLGCHAIIILIVSSLYESIFVVFTFIFGCFG